eukprot:Hpha_TRINITY_DN12978_c0_g1::TRINITY_DN12978_c0_g1_i1::g.164555::m.164555
MKVFARVRPAEVGQATGGYTSISAEEKRAVGTCFPGDATQSAVNDAAFAPGSLTEAVNRLCSSPHPYQALFLAYGQTGSGKTHTMLGPPGCLTEANVVAAGGHAIPSSWGLFPAVAGVTVIHAAATPLFVTVSAVEIYMNSLYDLLNDRSPIKVEGASVRAVANRVDFDQVNRNADGKWVPPTRFLSKKEVGEERACSTGSAAREVRLTDLHDVARVARTVEVARSAQKHSLNDRSSRSHCLITLKVEHLVPGTDRIVTSSIVFGDLAGSERIYKSGVVDDTKGGARKFSFKGLTIDVPGSRLDEARTINNSLASLGRVLNSVARREKFVSYRDTTLTQVLKPMLESQATDIKVVLALSDALVNLAESRSTLRFGGSLLATQRPSRGAPATGAHPKSAAATKGAAESSSATATLSSRVKRLSAACEQMSSQLATMERDGRAGHVVVAPEFPAPTRKAFLENKAKYEGAQRSIRELKGRILERKSELTLQHAPFGGDSHLGSMVQSLKHAQEARVISEGVYIRQLTTGIWAPAVPQYRLIKTQLETQQSRLEFLSAMM